MRLIHLSHRGMKGQFCRTNGGGLKPGLSRKGICPSKNMFYGKNIVSTIMFWYPYFRQYSIDDRLSKGKHMEYGMWFMIRVNTMVSKPHLQMGNIIFGPVSTGHAWLTLFDLASWPALGKGCDRCDRCDLRSSRRRLGLLPCTTECGRTMFATMFGHILVLLISLGQNHRFY